MEGLQETHTVRGGSFKAFFVREDPIYDKWARVGQPKSAFGGAAYLALYLLPGLIAAVVINARQVFVVELRVTHLSPRYLQFGWLLIITLGWHLLSPFVFLRLLDRLTIRESLSFLGIDRIDLKGLFLVLPISLEATRTVSMPSRRSLCLCCSSEILSARSYIIAAT